MAAAIDDAKFHAFVGKMLGDLGGAMSVPTVRLGLRLGLFDALADASATAADLARRAGGLHERYVREWALAQAANGYVDYDPASEQFSLSPEQAMVFHHRDSPVYLAGAFELVAAMIEAEPKVEDAFRTGEGVGWGESGGCLFCAVGAFFRPGYVNNIIQSWLPALDGVLPKLEGGDAFQLRIAIHTLAIVESSAGGLINAAMVAVPGASAYYLGGCIVYTAKSRLGLLDIDELDMAGFRSASERYASMIAERVRSRCGATWGLSETGASGRVTMVSVSTGSTTHVCA